MQEYIRHFVELLVHSFSSMLYSCHWSISRYHAVVAADSCRRLITHECETLVGHQPPRQSASNIQPLQPLVLTINLPQQVLLLLPRIASAIEQSEGLQQQRRDAVDALELQPWPY